MEGERQWVVELDTGRFGDWVIVTACSEAEARSKLTRAQKRKAKTVKPSYRTGEAPQTVPRARRR